ncbi:MAG: POTRA domain-containing protein, partial [Bradymonadaceae bacterium]
IREIEFDGVKPPPFRSDLRKLLSYRPGQIYRGDPAKKDAQLRSLESAFEKAGFFGTEIEMVVEEVSPRRKLVDITFKIDRGRRFGICDIGIRGLRSLDYATARQRLLSSLPILSRWLRLIPPRYTAETLEQGADALVHHYRRQGYFQARVLDSTVQRHPDRRCVTILVDVREGPHWELNFEGSDVFRDAELRRELPFVESGYVDGEAIDRAERSIEQLYETRGYPLAEVEGRESVDDRLHRKLVFEIEEGPKLTIAGIRFHGRSALSRRKLLDQMGTESFRLFSTGGFLQTEQLLNDLRTLEEVYRRHGYLRARVTRWELEILEGDQLRLHIYIEEGDRTVADSVRYVGVRSLARGRISKRLKTRSGGPFVPVRVRADRSRLLQLYASAGYPLATVETTCETLDGEEVPCRAPDFPRGCVAKTLEVLANRCGWASEQHRRYVCRRVAERAGGEACRKRGGVGDARAVRVVHRADEGPLISAGEFLVLGNFHTERATILREIPLAPGDIFDVQEVLEGQRNLRSLGIFDSVSIDGIGVDESASGEEAETRSAAVSVKVEESRNRFFDLKFGLEGRDVFGDRPQLLTTGEVQYTDRNFLGIADEIRPRIFGAADMVELSRFGGAAVSDSAGPQFRSIDYLFGAEFAYRDRRFLKRALGVDKLSLTVRPFYFIDLLGVTNDELLREEWGLRLELRKELVELLRGFYVRFGLEGKQSAIWPVGGPRVDGERIFSPRRFTGKLIPELTLDRRDSPLNPKKGYYLRFKPQYVTGDALSPSVDTLEDSYFRLGFTGKSYHPFWSDLVFSQTFRFGQIVPVSGREQPVPLDEVFYLGGAGTVRGFQNNAIRSVGRADPGGEFMLNYSVELRYPLIASIDLRGATFFDTGLLADCFPDGPGNERGCYRDAFAGGNWARKLRHSAGLGLRYVIGGQFPVLLDYAIVLDRRRGESIGNLHFHLGYTF